MIGNNPVGIYEKALDPSDDWFIRLEKAKKCGYDFVEISIDESDERLQRLSWDRPKKKELKDAVWTNDMPILSMCLSGHRRFPFGSSDPGIVSKAYDILDRALDFCLDIGIRTIQLAGYDVYYEKSNSDTLKRFMEGLHYSVEMAAKKEVMLAMEIMDTPLMSSISRYRWYKKQIPSPWFHVYPDIGNLSAWGNNVESEIRDNIDEIVAFHLKETLAVTKEFKGKFKCVPFGTGCVDFPAFFRLMEELNFTGPYMVEMWHQPGDNDVEKITEALQFMKSKYDERPD